MAALAIECQPMTTILLYGKLRQFGRSFRLSVRTPAEAIKAPAWAAKAKQTLRLGHHVFFKDVP